MSNQNKYNKRRSTSAMKNSIWIPLVIVLLAFFLMLVPMLSVEGAQPTYYRSDTGETGSVILEYPLADAEFSIYLVGTSNEEGGYTLESPFSEYDINLNSSDAAATLAAYVKRDGDSIQPLYTVTSDRDGIAYFNQLKRGVYLIIGETIENGEYTYVASPALFELPNLEKAEDGSNTYEEVWSLTLKDKFEKKKTPEEETTELEVLKVWKNDDEDSRPKSITVQLLCDGELSDREDAEVTLTKDDGWTHTWTDLSVDHEWTAVEKSVPDGYTVNNTRDGNSLVITNTKTTPSTPGTTGTPSKSSGKLPQTGQLWWPVSVFTAVGLFCIFVGLLLDRKQ